MMQEGDKVIKPGVLTFLCHDRVKSLLKPTEQFPEKCI